MCSEKPSSDERKSSTSRSKLAKKATPAPKIRAKRGRPKGAKTEQLDQVVEVPQACRRCKSTEYRVITTPKQLDLEGVFGGSKYNRVTFRRVRCRGCGQVYMRKAYRLIV
jgi:hypothetical protein